MDLPSLGPRLRLWHTAGVVVALLSQTPANTGFSVTGLIFVAIFFALAYPLQKRLRETASRRRKERWAREGLMPLHQAAVAEESDGPGTAGEVSPPDDGAEGRTDRRRGES